jgi:hypothetical protein
LPPLVLLTLSKERHPRHPRQPLGEAAKGNYIIDNAHEAPWRVLFSHETPNDRSKSLVGEYGYLEWSNYILSGLVYVVYAVVRPFVVPVTTYTSILAQVSVVVTALMFWVSVGSHIFSTVTAWATLARSIDHIMIYVSIATATVADTALATRDFDAVPIQTIIDSVLAATILGVYFSVRRRALSQNETRNVVFDEGRTLDLVRVQYPDLEHTALRIASVGALTLYWIHIVPALFTRLPRDVHPRWLAGAVTGTVLFALGVIVYHSNVLDFAFAKRLCMGCTSREWGCIMHAHAWWHLASFAGTVLVVIARDYGIMVL